MYYYKKLNLICFDKNDLRDLFQHGKFSELLKEMKHRRLSLQNLAGNELLMDEITDFIVLKSNKRKEDVEIFSALDYVLLFCPDNCKICFELKKGLNPNNLTINNIEDLKMVIAEATLTDFGVLFDNKLRIFQLTQHKEELTTKKLLASIKKKLNKYGNNLGKTNLLVLLQGKKGTNPSIDNIDFDEIHRHLLTKDFKFTGQILITYNEQDNHQVINQVYPNLTTSRRKIDQDYWSKWVD